MPIYPNEVCPICNENPNLQYICESCHEVFCEDCVELRTEEEYICISCGGKQISFDKYDQPICDGCGSREVRPVNKVVPTCRNCESSQVVRIVDKQKELIDNYKQIITSTRAFLQPLDSIVERLQTQRNKLFELRQEHPPCLHYPNLESDALLLFKLFDNGKNRVYDQANRFFQEIQRNIHYVNDIQITYPTNLTYIGDILQKFERERLKVEKIAQTEMEPLNTRLTELEDKIDFMERTYSLFNKFLPKMHLEDGEKIVFGMNCKLASGVDEQQGYSSKNGTILITSKRVYFYHEQGVFKKRTVLLFSVQLADLQAAEVKGKLKKKVSLQFLNSMYNFSISKNKRDILVDWIERAQDFDIKNTLNTTHFKQMIKYRLTTKLFTEELENAIYNLVGYHGIRYTPGQARVGQYGKTPNHPNYANNRMFNPNMYRPDQKFNGNSNFSTNFRSKPTSNYHIRRNFSNFQNPPFRNNPYTTNPYPSPSIPNNSNYPRSEINTQQINHAHNYGQFTGLDSDPDINSYHYRPNSNPYINHEPRNIRTERNPFDTSNKFGETFFDPSAHSRFSQSQEPPFSPRPPPFTNSSPGGMNHPFPRNPPITANRPFSAPESPAGRSHNNPAPVNSPFNGKPFGLNTGLHSDPSLSEQQNIQEELARLRQDQYAFQKTMQKLEYQYDRGVISNPEFVKSYQDLSREYYIISNKIKHLENYLRENFEI